MKTPVALIIFNRPDTTKRVFEAIRQAKPPKLFVIADGLRTNQTGDIYIRRIWSNGIICPSKILQYTKVFQNTSRFFPLSYNPKILGIFRD